MDKIYIPTTTLNFNNILSTESISPENFYRNRNFGYKRFEKVEPNKFKNILIAYSKIPYFKINDNELDNYPLIIEISKDILNNNEIIKEEEIKGIKIYKIDKTIYLHPLKVNFCFFDKEEKNISLIKANSSIETKLLPIYNSTFKVLENNQSSFQWDKYYIENLNSINNNTNELVEEDRIIDKQKGFYYCYELGFLLQKIDSKNLNNSYAQKKLQELYIRNKKESLEVILKEIEILTEELNEIKLKKQENNYDLNFNRNMLDKFEDSIFKDNGEIYKNIINELIKYKSIYNIQTFLENRVDLTLLIGKYFKEAMSEKWENSEPQKYINSLLDNLENYQKFDINSYDNPFLNSIAIFILKGDEIIKLVESLKQNDIENYRIAFGLWGALFGFSAIPKTISNILFQEENKSITNTKTSLKDIYKKIHNLDINEEIKISYIEQKQIEINNQKIDGNIGISNQENQIEIPNCPKCGAIMLKKEPKPNDKWRDAFWGCSRYSDGCKGSRKLNYNENTPKIKERYSITEVIYKIIDYFKKDDSTRNLYNQEIKLTNLKKQFNNNGINNPTTNQKFKTNREIEELIKDDRRFEVIGQSPKKLIYKEDINSD